MDTFSGVMSISPYETLCEMQHITIVTILKLHLW